MRFGRVDTLGQYISEFDPEPESGKKGIGIHIFLVYLLSLLATKEMSRFCFWLIEMDNLGTVFIKWINVRIYSLPPELVTHFIDICIVKVDGELEADVKSVDLDSGGMDSTNHCVVLVAKLLRWPTFGLATFVWFLLWPV